MKETNKNEMRKEMVDNKIKELTGLKDITNIETIKAIMIKCDYTVEEKDLLLNYIDMLEGEDVDYNDLFDILLDIKADKVKTDTEILKNRIITNMLSSIIFTLGWIIVPIPFIRVISLFIGIGFYLIGLTDLFEFIDRSQLV